MVAILNVCCRPTLNVETKARASLRLLRNGAQNFSRIKPHNYLVIRIGFRWRLLSKNNGKSWDLLTHETCNKEAAL
ncbi:TPA: hypothetical protein ACV7RV_002933 [Escherichia coli]|uniref:ParE family toxin-like protein n=1 Tax=Escherichia coli TaxID=562 RepID=UPI000B800B54